MTTTTTTTIIDQNETHAAPQRLPFGAGPARVGYRLAAWLFTGGIVLQVFFAGLAVLVDATFVDLHRAFGSLIAVLPLVMLALAPAGRLPWRATALTALLFLLVALQFVFASLPPESEIGVLRALHTVNALALFWLAVHLSRTAGRALRAPSL